MTEKRFRVVHSTVTQKFVVVDNEHEEIFEGIKNRDNACRFSNLLNGLHEENEFLKIKNERTQEYLRQKNKRISDLITKKEDVEYELLHLKDMREFFKNIYCNNWELGS